jgi:hypothetical protein
MCAHKLTRTLSRTHSLGACVVCLTLTQENAATLVELEQWAQEHYPLSADGRIADADTEMTDKDISRIEACTAKLGDRVKKALAALQVRVCACPTRITSQSNPHDMRSLA